MRKLMISLVAVAVLGFGAAFAQQGLWAGVSIGFPGAAVHFGVEDVAAGLDVRGNAGFNYVGVSGFSLGVDVLYGLPVNTGDLPIDVYVGGGPGVSIGAPVGFAINAFGGAEFRLVDVGLPEGGIFLEIGPSIAILPAFAGNFVGRLGFNFHFQ